MEPNEAAIPTHEADHSGRVTEGREALVSGLDGQEPSQDRRDFPPTLSTGDTWHFHRPLLAKQGSRLVRVKVMLVHDDEPLTSGPPDERTAA